MKLSQPIVKPTIYVADFETTVYENQTSTEVWAAALVKIGTEDVEIFHSIEEFYNRLLNESGKDLIVYFHNLKFDGIFILDYLLGTLHYVQAETHDVTDVKSFRFDKKSDMPNRTVIYSISSMGQWYTITVRIQNRYIYFRDSLKLLPFSVKKIGKSFATKHKKSEIEYVGYRYAGCEITDEEQMYIANDVLVVKEALEIMFKEGHKELTIGSCCLKEYKRIITPKLFDELYPDLTKYELTRKDTPEINAEQYIRKSYKGGWCYLSHGKEHKRYYNGTTADVNSLYPSMMHSESENYYPVGYPEFWFGNYIPEEALKPHRYYFIRIRTQFKLKPNKLPFIQIKDNLLYTSTESLETSDIYDFKTNKYYRYYKDHDGNIRVANVTLTLTMSDYELIKEHYYLYNTEILSGCWFYSEKGIFDEYINKYKKIKQESTGAVKQLAKLFLNSLYGKFATSTYNSFKVAYMKDDESLGFFIVPSNDKKPIYIPVGSAITSYARCFTIRAAQANYYGKDKRGFIYADTDSIHCDLSPEEIKGINIHESDFCCWKIENEWDIGYFERQKTYIEHTTKEDRKDVEPYYNIKCAGMPDRCKQQFIDGLLDGSFTLEDFTIGLTLSGKLIPKRIKGGTVLVDTTYEMR